ncbi:DUF5641 domain-containing protein [Trichonephila inaurata madagascariensis]|uniref:DUF5641 domain-containing protein n=1 Tax=Trichonephila inaurata madagascariensis TaxID=2747483 RepID=A0A8X6X1Z7_9ARAC|nr:DUF5641 domain-containing protein [Trichonephila inaurata madagascariensis]
MPLIPRPDNCNDPLASHICKKVSTGEIRVRDHAHLGTGRINGLVHQVIDGVMENLIQISSSEHADMRDEDPIYDKVDYLSALQNRFKWEYPNNNFKIGDIVIVKDDNVPPAIWPLGKVIESHPANDDVVREITLRTVKGKGHYMKNVYCYCEWSSRA